MKPSTYLRHHGIKGMHWGQRAAKNIKDWANGKSLRVGQGKMSNLEFDKQTAKESGMSLKDSRALDKKYGAQRKEFFKKIGVDHTKIKDALHSIGYTNIKPSSEAVAQRGRMAKRINNILAAGIIAGLTLKSIKDSRS